MFVCFSFVSEIGSRVVIESEEVLKFEEGGLVEFRGYEFRRDRLI